MAHGINEELTIKEIDYSGLLAKYMCHVGNVEGSHFMQHFNTSLSEVPFSEQEIQTLQYISKLIYSK